MAQQVESEEVYCPKCHEYTETLIMDAPEEVQAGYTCHDHHCPKCMEVLYSTRVKILCIGWG